MNFGQLENDPKILVNTFLSFI